MFNAKEGVNIGVNIKLVIGGGRHLLTPIGFSVRDTHPQM